MCVCPLTRISAFPFFFSSRNCPFFFFDQRKKKKNNNDKKQKSRGEKKITQHIYIARRFLQKKTHTYRSSAWHCWLHTKQNKEEKKKKTHNLHLFYPTARTGRSTIVFFFPHFDTSTRKSFRLFFFFFFCVYLIKKKKEREEKNKRQKEKRQ